MSLTALMRSLWAKLKGPTVQTNELEPPVIDLLPDIEGGATHLLRLSDTEQPLRVEIKQWQNSNPSPENPETLTIYWDDDDVNQKSWTAEIPDSDRFILVPQNLLLIEGEHTLVYEVALYNGNRSRCLPFTITIDRTPPELPANNTLVFDPDVISGGVTDAYLIEHKEELEATVPTYVGISAGDVVTWYWTTSPSGTEQAGSKTLALKDIGQPLKIIFPGKHIRDMGDGTRYAHYTVQDRAGTPVQRSQAVTLDARPTPLPVDFSAPYLKETGSSGSSSTLDPTQALTGATIVIKADNRFEPTDTVSVFWGNPGDYGAYDAPVEVVPGAIECPIPKANVAARMGSELVLYFEVTRRGVIHPSRSHALTVQAPRNLPHPQSTAIQGNKLSLSAMGAQATFTLPTGWSLRDTTQFVRLHITGKRNDGSNAPVVVADVTPVPSPTGAMTVGAVTPAALGVFTVNLWLEVEAFLSVDNKSSWIPFPYVQVQLVS
ncbi:hypothetical protein ACIP01_08725 [Pseudomonas monteilii]|uniref:hypothetical protein n=1 Tax=Pseudomonas monteilii TaxID=76759 RepID=UPI003805947C